MLSATRIWRSGTRCTSIFWLRDESLEDAANLPEPDVIAAEIIEDLGAALAQFELIQRDLATTEA